MLKIGVIADDFTGATDIASFLVAGGLPCVQLNGVPDGERPAGCEAVVIGLKTRSCAAAEAINQSLAALAWLKRHGCRQIYFKYCSTFDSTPQGNIGPVTDALMAALQIPFTVFSPALPVNGRTVWQGYLFVGSRLLAESGMRHHPLNPMTDSWLPRLVAAQAAGRCGVIPGQILDQGAQATRQAMARLQQEGYRYAVLDAISERQLDIQGEALRDLPLVTGGSGLAIGLARQWVTPGRQAGSAIYYPLPGRTVVLSGSCSPITHRQVTHYRRFAPAREVEVVRCLASDERLRYAGELAEWVMGQESELAPLVYATVSAAALAKIHHQYGAASSSHAVEALFSRLAALLADCGVNRFIVAGGETAGVVTRSLGIHGFHIGPAISPGVPWVTALDKPVSMTLKSGNFGDEAFFSRAQREFP